MDCPISRIGLLAVLALACQPGAGAAASEDAPGTQDQPSLELLEFLGRFETDTGEWIDPDELLRPEFDQLLESAGVEPTGPTYRDDQDASPEPDNVVDADEN